MSATKTLLSVLSGTLLFVLLFYHKIPGINLFIFEVVLFGLLVLNKRISFRNVNHLVGAGSLLVTSFCYVLYSSDWVIFINIVSFYVCMGVLMHAQLRSMVSGFFMAFENNWQAPVRFVSIIRNSRVMKRPGFSWLFRYAYMLIPALIVIVFIAIYSASNPIFDDYMVSFGNIFGDLFSEFFEHLDGAILGLFILGLFIMIMALTPGFRAHYMDWDQKSSLWIERQRIVRAFKKPGMMDLKKEWLAGIALLIALNALLFVVNCIDVYWVWFNFEWDGGFLKQFVHEGTYLLILSILISMGIVLYFFRRNQNFFSRNKSLRRLCYVWLGQNIILTISVVVRNLHYIDYFALAYKRIAVMFFLALVIIGLVSVFLKVRDRKSNFFLFKINAFAIFLALVSSTVIHWDMVIARYNVAHSQQAFYHLDFMSSLHPSTFVYTDLGVEELVAIKAFQQENYPNEYVYQSPREYQYQLDLKMRSVIELTLERHWLEWTLADHRARAYVMEHHPEIVERVIRTREGNKDVLMTPSSPLPEQDGEGG